MTHYLLTFNNDIFFNDLQKMRATCIFVGFNCVEDIVIKIWNDPENLKKLFFNEPDSNGNNGNNNSYLVYKFPFPNYQFDGKIYAKNKKYYQKHPEQFIKILELTMCDKVKTHPSFGGYYICDSNNVLLKILAEKSIYDLTGEEHRIYNDF
jgi:hypothetical protein